MRRQYTIEEARDQLARIVQDVEAGEEVELTREGRPVAVLASIPNHERPPDRSTSEKNDTESLDEFRRRWNVEELGITPDIFPPPRSGGFFEALEKFRSEHDLDEIWAEGDPFEGVRDRSPGREFNW